MTYLSPIKMNELAIFEVLKYDEGSNFLYAPQLRQEQYDQVLAIANLHGLNSSGAITQRRFLVRCAPDNPALKLLLEALKKFGWEVSDAFVPRGPHTGRFNIPLTRIYDQSDYDAAELFYLDNWEHLTDFDGRDGLRWIGKVDYVGKVTNKGWRQSSGTIGQRSFFVNDKLKDELSIAGFRGLKYHALCWDNPSKAKGNYWELDTELKMPACLVPVMSWDGPPAYHEGAYDPGELQFRRKEVEALGDFDIAWTQEKTGDMTRADVAKHVLVVSPKFRDFFRKIDPENFYGIVRLV